MISPGKESVSFDEYLEKYGSLSYSNVGVSMLPLLRQGKDVFVVQKKGSERCKRGDVVLYHRPPDKYVLHRIIEVRPDDYVILGDNCVKKEYGITDSDIIGVMSGFSRSGRQHGITGTGYRIYTYMILHTMGLRVFFKKVVLRLRSRLKKVLQP